MLEARFSAPQQLKLTTRRVAVCNALRESRRELPSFEAAAAEAMGEEDADGGNVYHFPSHLTAIPKPEAFIR